MMKSLLAWSLAAALAGLNIAEAAAGASHRANCRPYTVEERCTAGYASCGLKMVYAPHQDAGSDRYGYWYSVPRRHQATHHRHHATATVVRHHHGSAHRAHHHSVHTTHCTYNCWYRHPPEHGLPFGD
jgi:hypothetical protein